MLYLCLRSFVGFTAKKCSLKNSDIYIRSFKQPAILTIYNLITMKYVFLELRYNPSLVRSWKTMAFLLPVAVTTSQYSLPKAPSLKPPGSERLPASCTGFSFQTYSTSLLAQPSEVGD